MLYHDLYSNIYSSTITSSSWSNSTILSILGESELSKECTQRALLTLSAAAWPRLPRRVSEFTRTKKRPPNMQRNVPAILVFETKEAK
ncbi:hypothetical protein Q1695_000563 [Nippostrongylus brasiliensis]|nr:hypothetical protein Q1695_000563 [Nippostrongylus brasiliensis]